MNNEFRSDPATAPPVPLHLRNTASTERWMDDELAQSFPASDPPSWTFGVSSPRGFDGQQP